MNVRLRVCLRQARPLPTQGKLQLKRNTKSLHHNTVFRENDARPANKQQ